MIIGGELDGQLWRFATIELARTDHAYAVVAGLQPAPLKTRGHGGATPRQREPPALLRPPATERSGARSRTS